MRESKILKKHKSVHDLVYRGMSHVALYFVFFVITILLELAINVIEPLLGGRLTSQVLNDSIGGNSIVLGLVWIIIFTFRYGLEILTKSKKVKFKNLVYMNLHKRIFSHILNLNMTTYHRYGSGYLLSRQNDDIENIDGILLYNILEGISSVVLLVIIFVLMLKINLLLGGMCVLLVFLSYWINFAFPLKKLYKEQNEAKANYSSDIYDSVLGLKQIKLSDKVSYEESRQSRLLENYFKKRNNRDQIDVVRRSLNSFFDNLHYPVIIIIGLILISNSIMSVSEVIVFILFFQKINGAITYATNFIPLMRIGYASAERLLELLNLEVERKDLTSGVVNKLAVSDKIKFENVSFRYEDDKVFERLNLKLYPRKINAVVGASGSGKSTLVNLLLGFIGDYKGSISIDGINLRSYSDDVLRRSIAVVTQDNFLFNRSVLENIIYSSNEADETNYDRDRLEKVMKRTSIYNKIESLQHGLDERVGQLGSTLSGGEKQKICIARELYKDSNILIFDEATSALDSISEEFIKKLILNLSSDKTILTIAHRLSSVIYADVINVLYGGKIVESGSHEELLKAKGYYYDLYCNQLQD